MRVPASEAIVLRRAKIIGPSREAQAGLLLDTGAALTTLSRSILELAGYDVSQATASKRIVTGNGVVEVPVMRVLELRIEELTVKDLLVCVHEMP